MPRNLDAGAGQVVADDRAERRMRDGRVRAEAGLERVRAAFVVAFLALERADERDAVHLVGELFETGGELHALRGRVDRRRAGGDVRPGLRVERLQLTRPAAHPEHDDRLRRRPLLLRDARKRGAERSQPRQPGRARGGQKPATVDVRHQWFHDISGC